jgi:hypothetical protein
LLKINPFALDMPALLYHIYVGRYGTDMEDRPMTEVMAARLTAALSNAAAFMALYDELKGLPREAVVAVADQFNGPVAPGTPKGKALGRILTASKADRIRQPFERVTPCPPP